MLDGSSVELMQSGHFFGSDLKCCMKFQHVIINVYFVSTLLDVFYVQLCERIVVTRDSLLVRDSYF